MIEVKDITAGYEGTTVLRHVSLSLEPGVHVLAGPNGCGKSTLLRTIAHLLAPSSGEIYLDGRPLSRLTQREIAQNIAYMPQTRNIPNITAGAMVLHGRFPYLSFPRKYRKEDRLIADQALREVGGEALRDRFVPSLSGGERQKVYLAMALAQDTPVILMDEPTTWLDIRNQLELMNLSRRIAAEGKTILLVLHDLCMALSFADRILLMHEGELIASDSPQKLYHSGALSTVFGVSIGHISTDEGIKYYYKGSQE